MNCLKYQRKPRTTSVPPLTHMPITMAPAFVLILDNSVLKAKSNPKIIMGKNKWCGKTQAHPNHPCRKATRSGSNLYMDSGRIHIRPTGRFSPGAVNHSSFCGSWPLTCFNRAVTISKADRKRIQKHWLSLSPRDSSKPLGSAQGLGLKP